MGSWVTASVAAELWNVPLGHVLTQIHSGQIPSRSELGFTLVEVEPGHDAVPASLRAPAPKPVETPNQNADAPGWVAIRHEARQRRKAPGTFAS